MLDIIGEIISGVIGFFVGFLLNKLLEVLNRMLYRRKSRKRYIQLKKFQWIFERFSGSFKVIEFLNVIPSNADLIDIRVVEHSDPPSDIKEIIRKHKKTWANQGIYETKVHIGVKKIIIGRKSELELPTIIINAKLFRYYWYLATNANLKLRKDITQAEYLYILRSIEDRSLAELIYNPPTKFANPLSVNIIVITKDDYIVIQDRSSFVAIRKNVYSSSVGEAVIYEDRCSGTKNKICIFNSIYRGLLEELGIERELIEEARILSLCFDKEQYSYRFVVLAKLNITYNDLRGFITLGRDSRFESKKIIFKKFTLGLLKDINESPDSYTPGLRLGILFALSEKFGLENVLDYLNRVIKE